jgi:hypothetical protein
MKISVRKIALIFGVVLLMMYGLAHWWLHKQYTQFTFPKVQANATYFFAEKLKENALDYEKLELTSTYGNVETCLLPSRSEKNIWLIHLHSTDNLYYSDSNLWRYKVWNNLGINVITLNYIVEENNQRIASSEKMYQSALVAYNYLVTKIDVPNENILVYGEGLGSYPASKLAKEMNVAGVIIENGITSLNDFLQDLYPILAIRLIIKEDFLVKNYIQEISVPSLFIVSEKDEIYPARHTKILYENTNSSLKKLTSLKGKTNHFKNKDIKTYQKSLADFLKDLKLRII